MTFVIDSNKEESVNVFVRSKSGETQDIGDIALSGVSDNFVSFVFRSEYFCSDVVVKRADVSNENSWDDTRIHITQLSLSPVLVASEGQAASLEPSLLSVLRQEDVPVPSMIGGGSAAKQLSLKGGQIGNDVEANGEFITGMWVHPDLADTGESGEYVAEVSKYSGKGSHFDLKTAFSNKFSVRDFSRFETNDLGWYKIPLEGTLQKGETYLVGIKSQQTQSGEGTYLHLLPFGTDDGVDREDVFFVLDATMVQTIGSNGEVSDEDLVPGSILEDRGDAYTYEYVLKNNREGALSISDSSGGMEYDEGRQAIVMDSDKGAWYMYAFDTLHDIRKVYIEAAQLGSREGEIALEYSWDKEHWQDIPYKQAEGEQQIFRGTFSPDKKDRDTLYVRVKYALNEKYDVRFGLQSMHVFAELEK